MQNDTVFRVAPPVRIGLRMAATRMYELDRPAALSGQGNQAYVQAGGYGQREKRFASVPLQLRFVRNSPLSPRVALRNTKPINYTARKRGFPMATLESTGSVGRPVARPGSPGWGLNG